MNIIYVEYVSNVHMITAEYLKDVEWFENLDIRYWKPIVRWPQSCSSHRRFIYHIVKLINVIVMFWLIQNVTFAFDLPRINHFIDKLMYTWYLCLDHEVWSILVHRCPIYIEPSCFQSRVLNLHFQNFHSPSES